MTAAALAAIIFVEGRRKRWRWIAGKDETPDVTGVWKSRHPEPNQRTFRSNQSVTLAARTICRQLLPMPSSCSSLPTSAVGSFSSVVGDDVPVSAGLPRRRLGQARSRISALDAGRSVSRHQKSSPSPVFVTIRPSIIFTIQMTRYWVLSHYASCLVPFPAVIRNIIAIWDTFWFGEKLHAVIRCQSTDVATTLTLKMRERKFICQYANINSVPNNSRYVQWQVRPKSIGAGHLLLYALCVAQKTAALKLAAKLWRELVES